MLFMISGSVNNKLFNKIYSAHRGSEENLIRKLSENENYNFEKYRKALDH